MKTRRYCNLIFLVAVKCNDMQGVCNLRFQKPARSTVIHKCFDFSVAYRVCDGARTASWETPSVVHIAPSDFLLFVVNHRKYHRLPFN